MKSGGGHGKGAQFERNVGLEISHWLSADTRADLCRRTVLSGGQYTQGLKYGKINTNPGDITANDPLAFPFFEHVVIECKFWRDLELHNFIWKKTLLYNALEKVKGEAAAVHKMWAFITQQNNQPTLIFLPATFSMPKQVTNWHKLFEDSVYLIRFMEFLKAVPPAEFIELARLAHD